MRTSHASDVLVYAPPPPILTHNLNTTALKTPHVALPRTRRLHLLVVPVAATGSQDPTLLLRATGKPPPGEPSSSIAAHASASVGGSAPVASADLQDPAVPLPTTGKAVKSAMTGEKEAIDAEITTSWMSEPRTPSFLLHPFRLLRDCYVPSHVAATSADATAKGVAAAAKRVAATHAATKCAGGVEHEGDQSFRPNLLHSQLRSAVGVLGELLLHLIKLHLCLLRHNPDPDSNGVSQPHQPSLLLLLQPSLPLLLQLRDHLSSLIPLQMTTPLLVLATSSMTTSKLALQVLLRVCVSLISTMTMGNTSGNHRLQRLLALGAPRPPVNLSHPPVNLAHTATGARIASSWAACIARIARCREAGVLILQQHAANPHVGTTKFAKSTSSGVLRKHLYEHHINAWVEGCDKLKIPIEAKEAARFVDAYRVHKHQKSSSTSDSKPGKKRTPFYKDAFVDAIVEFIVGDDQSINVVENEQLRAIFLMLRVELKDSDIPH
ncbi:hypothetical protein K438DRAFT_1976772 [Mycena galopus ATCC 62051]|nr:hypothetical protein K438DRAFT_1976772 [Mycena galopus ATCC 62051]